MSYQQAIKWGKKHPKGTRQPMLFSTSSGFWPASSWIENDWNPYLEACERINVEPFLIKVFYDYSCLGHIMSNMTSENAAKYTQARRLLGYDSP